MYKYSHLIVKNMYRMDVFENNFTKSFKITHTLRAKATAVPNTI